MEQWTKFIFNNDNRDKLSEEELDKEFEKLKQIYPVEELIDKCEYPIIRF